MFPGNYLETLFLAFNILSLGNLGNLSLIRGSFFTLAEARRRQISEKLVSRPQDEHACYLLE